MSPLVIGTAEVRNRFATLRLRSACPHKMSCREYDIWLCLKRLTVLWRFIICSYCFISHGYISCNGVHVNGRTRMFITIANSRLCRYRVEVWVFLLNQVISKASFMIFCNGITSNMKGFWTWSSQFIQSIKRGTFFLENSIIGNY